MRYGTTCPLLKISREYGVDYGAVLYAADYHLHGRRPSDGFSPSLQPLQELSFWPRLISDILDVVEFMQKGHEQAAQLEREGRLVFNMYTGKWTVV